MANNRLPGRAIISQYDSPDAYRGTHFPSVRVLRHSSEQNYFPA